jgi:tetratricopeptide (TPR) repeat protein
MLETNEDNDVRHNLGRDLDSLGDCRFKLGCKEEAEVNFREAIQHQSLVVKKAPQHYPWLCQHYQRLGRLLRDADRPKDAIAVAKDWRAQMPEDAGTLFNVAREFALSVPVFGRVRGQPAPTVAADQQACIDEAINALRQAFEKGFRTRDALRTDSAFEAIRDQPEFKRLAQQAKGSD